MRETSQKTNHQAMLSTVSTPRSSFVDSRKINRIRILSWKLICMICLTREARALAALCDNARHLSKLVTLHRSWSTTLSLQAAFSQNFEPTFCQSSVVEQWLDVELPEGRCVGVASDGANGNRIISEEIIADPRHWAHQFYHPEELAYGTNLPFARRESFWLGRLSMRLALDGSCKDHPILKDTQGRPRLPLGTFGSISHKRAYGVALVKHDDTSNLAGVGVDLEHTTRKGRRNIGKRVLTDNEIMDLGKLSGISAEEEVLLRFRYVCDIMTQDGSI